MGTKSPFRQALVEINWDTDLPPPAIRCPITGKVVTYGYDPVTAEVGVDDYVQPDWESIPTVLFHYMPEVGEFDYIRPALRQAIEDKKRELLKAATAEETASIEDLSDFEVLSDHIDDLGEVPLVMQLTTHGIACGPVHASVYIGLDLAASQRS